MKKILILILALATVLLLMTSCDVISGILGDDPTTDDIQGGDNQAPAFDSSSLKFIDRTFTYDGGIKTIVVGGNIPSGVTVQYEGNDQTNAGVYTVTAKFYKDGEYVDGQDRTATMTITPATYDMSGVKFTDSTAEYNGSEWKPVIKGKLPEGVSVEYTYGSIVNVGTYRVTAVFTGDPNYYPIDDMTINFVVTPASYDMSGVKLWDKMVEYDGNTHYIEIEGTLPEGVSVSYVNNGHSEIGEYVVEAVFSSGNGNYRVPAVQSATLIITPEATKPVSLLYNLKDDGTYEVSGWEGENPHLIIPATYKNKRVTSIASGAFEGNANIVYANIPATVTGIGNKAFKDCTSLASVNIRGSVTVIGYKAFANTALTEFVVPDTVEAIGQGAFTGTPLESITLPFIGGSKDSSNAYLGFLFGASSYSGNGATVPATLKTVILSDTATKIPAFAFFGISSLEDVIVGKGVSFIGNSAFYGTAIDSIYLPAGVTAIPADAGAYNSPFYGLGDGTVIMLESTAGKDFGKYWNAVAADKYAITVYMKTYDYYLENKDAIRDTDMSVATLDGITLDRDLIGGFDSAVLEYTADADINYGYPNVSAVPTSPTSLCTVEQASSENGGVATITVTSADLSNTVVYTVRFNVTGTFNGTADVVCKDGTTGAVTFVLDDGDHATAEFSVKMMNKYPNLRFTYALLVNKLATLKTEYDPTTGKYKYVMDEDGNYTYTVQQSEVDFWNNLLRNYNTEVISHTYSHLFWGNNDEGGYQKYVDSSGNVKTSGNLTMGSATAEIYASMQIIEELLGIRAITHTEPGIGVKTTNTTVDGVLYETYRTYYKELIDKALENGDIINFIGGTMGVNATNINRYVTKDNIKDPNGIARLFVSPNDNKAMWTQFIDNAAANNGWATFCIHKITPSASTGHYILESDAEALFAHAASKNVWIANFTEAGLYYAEWASAEVTTSYEDGKINVTLTDDEDNTVYDEELTVKVYVPATWTSAYMNGEALTVQNDGSGSFVYVNILPDSGTQQITEV